MRLNKVYLSWLRDASEPYQKIPLKFKTSGYVANTLNKQKKFLMLLRVSTWIIIKIFIVASVSFLNSSLKWLYTWTAWTRRSRSSPMNTITLISVSPTMNRIHLSRTSVRSFLVNASGQVLTTSSSWKTKPVSSFARRRTKEASRKVNANWWCWRKEWAWTISIIGSSTTCLSLGATRFKMIASTVQLGSRWVVSWEILETQSSTTAAHLTQRTINPALTIRSTTSTWPLLIIVELPRNGETLSSRTGAALYRWRSFHRPSVTTPIRSIATTHNPLSSPPLPSKTAKALTLFTRIQ